MPKYTVQMTRLAVVFREEEIEADSVEDAKVQALAEFKDDNHNTHGWTLDAIYDDGKPYCELSVNEVQPLDENGDPVGEPIEDES